MQLFDDPRYKVIRKKYDLKTYIGFGTVLLAMPANALIDSTSGEQAIVVLEFSAMLFVIWIGIKLRREIGALEELRKNE